MHILLLKELLLLVLEMTPIIFKKKNRPLALKNNVPFISCISKINGTLIENAEDLDIVMPMYNLLGDCTNLFEDIWFFMELLQR